MGINDTEREQSTDEEEEEVDKAQQEARERAYEEERKQGIEQSVVREGDTKEQDNPDFTENEQRRRN